MPAQLPPLPFSHPDITRTETAAAVAKVEAAITPRTKAIVAVEAFGHPGGMVELEQMAQRHELILIDDACEGFGGHVATERGPRPIGSFGRAGVFSFYPNKQITTG